MPRVVNINVDGCDEYVGRPSKWGNPFRVGIDGTREEVIALYKEHLLRRKDLVDSLPELRGLDLGCHCAPKPCHADVLLMLANSPRANARP